MTIIAAAVLGLLSLVVTHDLTKGFVHSEYSQIRASRDEYKQALNRCEEKVKASELYQEMRTEAVKSEEISK